MNRRTTHQVVAALIKAGRRDLAALVAAPLGYRKQVTAADRVKQLLPGGNPPGV